MNRTTTILLAALCALVGAFILFFEKDSRSTEQIREKAGRLYDVPAGHIDWVSIKNPHDRILLRRVDGRWRTVEPHDNPADAERVRELLWEIHQLAHARHFTVSDPAKDLEGYGLAPPAVVLRARWNGEEIELRLGARTPMGNSVYAQTRKNERDVYAIGAGLLDKLSRPAAEWRSRRIIDIDLERVDEIRLSGPTVKIRVERRGGHWFLKSPLKARASGARVRSLLSALNLARVERYVTDQDERLEDFGLKEPWLSLHLDVRDGEDVEVQLGKPDPENTAAIFARRIDAASIVTVSTNLPAELTLTGDDLRDKQVLPLDVESVQRIVLARGPDRLEAVLLGGQWKLVPSLEIEPRPANKAAIIEFLRSCASLNASAFLADAVTDPAALGLDKPGATVEFWSKGGDGSREGLKKDSAGRVLTTTLVVATPRKGPTPCVAEPEPFVVVVPEKDLAFLDVRPWDWLALDVRPADRPAPQAFSMECGGASLRFSRANNKWKSEPEAAVDQTAVESVFQVLCSLKAAKWLGPDAKVDRKKPRLCFRLETEGGASVLLWHQDDRWIALAQGGGASDLFFELPHAEGELLGQQLLHPRPEAPKLPKPDTR